MCGQPRHCRAGPALSAADVLHVIEMAWADEIAFEAIALQYGLNEAGVIRLMRRHLKPSSFRLWRKRDWPRQQTQHTPGPRRAPPPTRPLTCACAKTRPAQQTLRLLGLPFTWRKSGRATGSRSSSARPLRQQGAAKAARRKCLRLPKMNPLTSSQPAPDPAAVATPAPANGSTGWLTHHSAGGVVFWFRHDLRLHDNPALTHAVQLARQRRAWLLPVVIDPAQTTAPHPLGLCPPRPAPRPVCGRRRGCTGQALHALGTPLWVWHADRWPRRPPACSKPVRWSAKTLPRPKSRPPWPSEPGQPSHGQRHRGRRGTKGEVPCRVAVHLYTPEALPMPPGVPDTFTAFRRQLGGQRCHQAAPCPPSRPGQSAWARVHPPTLAAAQAPLAARARPTGIAAPSPVPAGACARHPTTPPWPGTAAKAAALAHLACHCASGRLPHHKATRNALTGSDHSSRWSPWLAIAVRCRPGRRWPPSVSLRPSNGASGSTFTGCGSSCCGATTFAGCTSARCGAVPGAGPGAVSFVCQLQRSHHAQRPGALPAGAAATPASRWWTRACASWSCHRLAQQPHAARIVWPVTLFTTRRRLAGQTAWFEHSLIDYDPCSNQGNWALHRRSAGAPTARWPPLQHREATQDPRPRRPMPPPGGPPVRPAAAITDP